MLIWEYVVRYIYCIRTVMCSCNFWIFHVQTHTWNNWTCKSYLRAHARLNYDYEMNYGISALCMCIYAVERITVFHSIPFYSVTLTLTLNSKSLSLPLPLNSYKMKYVEENQPTKKYKIHCLQSENSVWADNR